MTVTLGVRDFPLDAVQMARIGENMRHAIEALLPSDWDCPYPLTGGVNVPLPFDDSNGSQ